ncbi:hypothetical protein [Roseivirga echinicomitans]|uniref:DUF4348 domain-containing protein n=1 Tax=Roseivirga echinicomitans TaxID=296218 RepID=A0A150X1V5_9BACT|nr:hypothetical protein [Roseivirga echinicomitans]KYG72709.1 hypothetical protein AWN68_08355 [Roseivirga echinicomitans]
MSLNRAILIALFAVLCAQVSLAQKPEENFESFLKRFDADSSFQMSRILDSVIVVYTSDIIVDADGNGYTENYEAPIAKADWRFKKLEKKEFNNWEIRQLEYDIKELTMAGKQSGVYVVIEFVLRDGLWFLRKYGDYST